MATQNMSALWLHNLKNSDCGRTDYFDQKQKGLGLRVGKSRKTWFVMYRVSGDRSLKRLTMGLYPAMSLAEAREKARAFLVEVDKGNDPANLKQKEKKAPTVTDLVSEYLEKHASHKRSQYEDKRILEKDILPAWGKRKAFDIRRRDVIRLLDKIIERGAPIQANRTLALIRKLYNFGISRDLVNHNPCTQVHAPAKENQRDRVLSNEEIRALWDAFNSLRPNMGSMFKLRLLTAQRGGEIQTMKWSDIDFNSQWWTIPAEYCKNGLSHRVPLSSMALEILHGLREITGQKEWVFPSASKRKHKHGHITNVQKAAVRVKAYSGVENFTLHDLRRTAASYMTSMGISRLVVSKILNHVEQGITRVYDRHSYDQEKRLALDKWSSKLNHILTGRKAHVIQFARAN